MSLLLELRTVSDCESLVHHDFGELALHMHVIRYPDDCVQHQQTCHTVICWQFSFFEDHRGLGLHQLDEVPAEIHVLEVECSSDGSTCASAVISDVPVVGLVSSTGIRHQIVVELLSPPVLHRVVLHSSCSCCSNSSCHPVVPALGVVLLQGNVDLVWHVC